MYKLSIPTGSLCLHFVPPPNGACRGGRLLCRGCAPLRVAPPPAYIVPLPAGSLVAVDGRTSRGFAHMQGAALVAVRTHPHTGGVAHGKNYHGGGVARNFAPLTTSMQCLWNADGHKGRALPVAEKRVAWRRCILSCVSVVDCFAGWWRGGCCPHAGCGPCGRQYPPRPTARQGLHNLRKNEEPKF